MKRDEAVRLYLLAVAGVFVLHVFERGIGVIHGSPCARHHTFRPWSPQLLKLVRDSALRPECRQGTLISQFAPWWRNSSFSLLGGWTAVGMDMPSSRVLIPRTVPVPGLRRRRQEARRSNYPLEEAQ
ncbi:hypothetical protein CC78DRAFT_284351 [Lojkania enalia]|uniref:Uncharacterized protein n=1 Tax=Lojkania enalia TaxID=147567 RepID=A0A9P4KC24_9PLEO|nr:hypothetical protein CC78DRAFT_284351 [Didymosphaeria enalia]